MTGEATGSHVFIDDVECTALINSGAQISTITISFTQSLALEIKKLQRIISIEGTRGRKAPYFGYIEINL